MSVTRYWKTHYAGRSWDLEPLRDEAGIVELDQAEFVLASDYNALYEIAQESVSTLRLARIKILAYREEAKGNYPGGPELVRLLASIDKSLTNLAVLGVEP